MIKRCMVFLLACLFLFTMLPAADAAGAQYIDEVEITLPLTIGQELPTSGRSWESRVSVAAVNINTLDSIARAGENYECVLELEASEGYYFGGSCRFLVNGIAATLVSGGGTEEARIAVTLQPDVAIVDELIFSTGPVQGWMEPSYDVWIDSTCGFDGEVTIIGWMDNTDLNTMGEGDTFVAGHTYRVYFSVQNGETSGIDFDTPIYINGFSGSVAANEDGNAACFADIVASEGVPTALTDRLDMGIDLTIGKALPTTGIPYSEHFSVASVQAAEEDSVALAEKSYHYSIELEANPGFYFDSECPVFVNDQKAEVVSGAGTSELRLSVTLQPQVQIIDELRLTMVEPVAGGHASFELQVSEDSKFDGTVELFQIRDCDADLELSEQDIYQEGHSYRLYLHVKDGPTQGIVFETPIYVNDHLFSVAANENGEAACFGDIENVQAPKAGDVNVDTFVNLKDVSLLFRSCTGQLDMASLNLVAADVNHDSAITLKDVFQAYQNYIKPDAYSYNVYFLGCPAETFTSVVETVQQLGDSDITLEEGVTADVLSYAGLYDAQKLTDALSDLGADVLLHESGQAVFCKVRISDIGKTRLVLIRAVKAYYDIGLKEAKERVEKPSGLVACGLTPAEAVELATLLRNNGATVSIELDLSVKTA